MKLRIVNDRSLAVLMTALVVLVSPYTASAQTAGYAVISTTVDGGGGTSSSADGRFSVSGSIGQPDAGWLDGTPGRYSLNGGFWGAGFINTVTAVTLLTCLGLTALITRSGALRLRRKRSRP